MQRPSLWLYLPTNTTRPPVSGFIIRSMSSLGHIAIANIYICTHIYIMCAIYGPVPISVENSCRLYFGGIARTFLFHPSHCLLISRHLPAVQGESLVLLLDYGRHLLVLLRLHMGHQNGLGTVRLEGGRQSILA